MAAWSFILFRLSFVLPFFFFGKVADHLACGVENIEGDLGSFGFAGIAVFFAGIVLFRGNGRGGIAAGCFLGFVRLLQRGFQPIVDDRACGRILAGVWAATEERAGEDGVIGRCGRE